MNLTASTDAVDHEMDLKSNYKLQDLLISAPSVSIQQIFYHLHKWIEY